MRIIGFIPLAILIIFSSWRMQEKSQIEQAEWLLGTWENRTSKGNIYETWSKESKNEFSGLSYIIKDNDTIVFETIRLCQTQGGLYYIPKVRDQNEGLPITFNMTEISDSALVFENPDHDFPQKISYHRINTDSLIAEISGVKNGNESKHIFRMKRVE